MTNIHIFWSGPFSLTTVKTLNDEDHHFGIYQVYGHHHLYGDNVLMYIGKAEQQTFGVRIAQEDWPFYYDPENFQIYIGQLASPGPISEEKWEQQIRLAEKLLIYAHNPACNTVHTKRIDNKDIRDVVVHNWNSFRDLFPTVAGSYYSTEFDAITENNILSYYRGNVK